MKDLNPNIPLYVKRFFSEHLPGQRNYSLNTITSYRDAIRLFLLYLHDRRKIAPSGITITDICAKNIMDFLGEIEESRNNSVATRNVRLAAIRSFVNYLLLMEPTLSCDLQSILVIPVKRANLRVLDFLTHEEMDAVIDAPNEQTWSGRRDSILFEVMYNTGARVSEIVGVKVRDVKLGHGGTIRLMGKGRKERTLPLWKGTAKALSKWIAANQLNESDALFGNARGDRMTRSGVEKRLRDAVLRASDVCPSLKTKRVSPHTIRHTTAMHLLQAGVDITLIAMWLGHESIETTHIYVTTDMEMKEKALKALQEPPSRGNFRFRPSDRLLAFLESI
jgi:site-specific recombinase XerD